MGVGSASSRRVAAQRSFAKAIQSPMVSYDKRGAPLCENALKAMARLDDRAFPAGRSGAPVDGCYRAPRNRGAVQHANDMDPFAVDAITSGGRRVPDGCPFSRSADKREAQRQVGVPRAFVGQLFDERNRAARIVPRDKVADRPPSHETQYVFAVFRHAEPPFPHLIPDSM